MCGERSHTNSRILVSLSGSSTVEARTALQVSCGRQKTRDLRWRLHSGSIFVFHQVNAFEKDGKIYLDASCFHDNTIIEQTYLHNMRSPIVPGEKKLDVPDIRRYELPLEDLGNVKEGKPLKKGADGLDYTLLHSGIEFPRFNDADNNCKPYKFAVWRRS